MRTPTELPPVRDSRSLTVVSKLVKHGLVSPDRASEAVEVVDRALATQEAPPAPLRNRFAELAGYLGGALVVAAAAIFFASEWANLSHAQQVGLLAGTTALLAVTGAALAITAGGFARIRAGQEPVRRRLAGVLFTGAAASAAAAVGLQLSETLSSRDSTPALVGFLTLLVLSAGGYLLSPTIVGQLGVAVGAFGAVPSLLDVLGDNNGGDVQPVAFGLIVLGIGVIWLVLAERGVWREVATARILGCVLLVVGAQIPVFEADASWVAYLALTLVAVAAFGIYLVRPAWPYLATGVVGVTLAVPEALLDWTEGSIGAAGGLLVAGGSLLVASLVGLRLRKEVAETDEPAQNQT